MLLAKWLDVSDAMVFLDAFAEAAEKTRGWKLDRIKTDFGHQFVYVCYTGRKFTGKGLMAYAFAPVHQYRDCKGAVLACVDASTKASPIRTPSASAGRSTVPKKLHRPSLALRVPIEQRLPSQRVNLTLRAEVWPEHVCFDDVAKSLLSPLLKSPLGPRTLCESSNTQLARPQREAGLCPSQLVNQRNAGGARHSNRTPCRAAARPFPLCAIRAKPGFFARPGCSIDGKRAIGAREAFQPSNARIPRTKKVDGPNSFPACCPAATKT